MFSKFRTSLSTFFYIIQEFTVQELVKRDIIRITQPELDLTKCCKPIFSKLLVFEGFTF